VVVSICELVECLPEPMAGSSSVAIDLLKIIASDFEHLRNEPGTWPAFHLQNDIERFGDGL
jgi:hypothetical protein